MVLSLTPIWGTAAILCESKGWRLGVYAGCSGLHELL